MPFPCKAPTNILFSLFPLCSGMWVEGREIISLMNPGPRSQQARIISNYHVKLTGLQTTQSVRSGIFEENIKTKLQRNWKYFILNSNNYYQLSAISPYTSEQNKRQESISFQNLVNQNISLSIFKS